MNMIAPTVNAMLDIINNAISMAIQAVFRIFFFDLYLLLFLLSWSYDFGRLSSQFIHFICIFISRRRQLTTKKAR